MSRNLTGLPNTDDYTLGRGTLYVCDLDTTGKPTNIWRDLGNVTDMKLSFSSTSLKHTSTRAGLATTDKEVVLTQEVGVSFNLDELNDQNLALGLSGNEASFTNSAIAGFVEWNWLPTATPSNIKPGYWYDITNASGVRAYDIDSTKLTVKTLTGAVTLVKGTDYLVDEEMGRIQFIVANSVTGAGSAAIVTAIAANDGIKITLTADATASAINEIQAVTKTVVAAAFKFIQVNAVTNLKREFSFHKLSLKVDGDFDLIGEDWTKIPFSGVAGTNPVGGSVASPTLTIRNIK